MSVHDLVSPTIFRIRQIVLLYVLYLILLPLSYDKYINVFKAIIGITWKLGVNITLFLSPNFWHVDWFIHLSCNEGLNQQDENSANYTDVVFSKTFSLVSCRLQLTAVDLQKYWGTHAQTHAL